MLGLGSIGTIIYVLTIIDVVRSSFHTDTDKVIWVLIVVLLPLLGTLLWFLIGRGRTVL
ncbi:PLDc N-terminal domain-containing protein [Echinicola sp. CAU 1574]|uniref:PLDc N-terminal domain-containing protein n=1 Tax=Echinicola arenosa TaxID=2774144 RepID=A0ABR9AMY3_9BACT|nr:PLDc N-terminal domain-containing protein [Echinicola arenosa]MBD8489707.1 PLDc N-terminal domain-containing protein [Echinicola arenosa]